MASVQWGSTGNAFLAFTASAALRELSNGPGTIAILWKPVGGAATGADGGGLTDAQTPGSLFYHTIVLHDTALWGDDCQAGAWVGTTTTLSALTAGDWYIAVVDWAGGAAAKDRFHWWDATAAGAWTHEDSYNNNGGGIAAPSSAWFKCGYTGDFTIGSGQQIALIAAWAGVRLSDTQVAALSTNRQTSDWYNNAAGHPTFLSEITSLTPSDIGTGSSAFSGANSLTTNLTVGGDPAGGWNFDGVGAAPADPATIRTLTSPRLV